MLQKRASGEMGSVGKNGNLKMCQFENLKMEELKLLQNFKFINIF
ncbi:MAG: hypothetical protein JWP12_2674 [Bacteroidetes bacterium]|nr:hypothetical protein [Bacteroidota bacterium]